MRQAAMRDVRFVGSSLDDLRALPKPARHDLGRQIDRVQRGLSPRDWRPMPSVGRGVREIRVRSDGGAYRALYVTSGGPAVYVVHVFAKQSRRTSRRDVQLARTRLKSLRQRLGENP